MLPISATVISAISGAIGQACTLLAQSTGLDYVVKRLMAFWRQHATQQQLNHAIQTAIAHFDKAVHDPLLVQALQHDQAFFLRPDVLALLGEIATTPAFRPERLERLGQLFQSLVPTLRPQRAQQAARVLAECLYSEVMQIPTLREELRLIQQEAVHQRLKDLADRLTPLPPFENELDRQMNAAAITLAKRLHNANATTAHLLYLLVKTPDSATHDVFAHLHKRPQDLLVALGIIKQHDGVVHPTLTNGSRAALSDAQRLAGEQRDVFTRDIHLLEALLDQAEREGEQGLSMLALLHYIGVSVAEVRAALHQVVPTDSFSMFHRMESIPQMETMNLFPDIIPDEEASHE